MSKKDWEDQLETVIGSMRLDAQILDALSMQYPHREGELTRLKDLLAGLADEIEKELLPPVETKT